MRLARLSWGGSSSPPQYARLQGAEAHPVEPPPWGSAEQCLQSVRSLADATYWVPCVPTKILAVGRNYAAHAAELGNEVPSYPLWFLKPPSALVPHGGAIVWPPDSARVDFEGEIAVVIGTRASRVGPEDALRHIFGYTAFNDVTARDLQRADGQFTRGKGFDTFAPCGPWIETELALDAAEIRTRVDGDERQRGVPAQMVFSVAHLVSLASHVMTLEPGDLLATGTPEGVGPLQVGQTVEVDVAGIGVLRNQVVAQGGETGQGVVDG